MSEQTKNVLTYHEWHGALADENQRIVAYVRRPGNEENAQCEAALRHAAHATQVHQELIEALEEFACPIPGCTKDRCVKINALLARAKSVQPQEKP